MRNGTMRLAIRSLGLAFLMIGLSAFRVWSSSPEPVTGIGTMTGVNNTTPLTLAIHFLPKGGPVSGEISGESELPNPPAPPCKQTFDGTVDGEFAGGDGGAAFGTLQVHFTVDCGAGKNEQTYSGNWEGKLHADGNGSGTWQAAGFTGDWYVVYSATEFAAGLVEQTPTLTATPSPTPVEITAEYITRTYGVGVDVLTKKELQLIDEVLRVLPREFWDHTFVNQVVRAGQESARTAQVMGDFTIKNGGTITLYDMAFTHRDYSAEDDPDGSKQFKATLMHELTHARLTFKDKLDMQAEKYLDFDNPLLIGFEDISRPDPTQRPSEENGWYYEPVTGLWSFQGGPGQEPPTEYGGTDPEEDMCESVMLYVMQPDVLKEKSQTRYDYIRTKLFGGVEYEDGIPKS